MNKIIIFSHGRSGGNLLEGILCNNKKIKSFGELLFNRGLNSLHIQTIGYNGCDLIKETEKEYSNYDILLYRLHTLNGLSDVMKLIDNDWYKILLFREDFIQKLVSYTIASQTMKWHMVENATQYSYNNFKVYLNKKGVDVTLSSVNEYYSKVLSMFNDIHIIKYEDLLKLDIQPIFDTFMIDKNNLKIHTLKLSDIENNRDILINANDFLDSKYMLKPPFTGI